MYAARSNLKSEVARQSLVVRDYLASAAPAGADVVRDGARAWRDIKRVETWEAWLSIGAALLVGRHHAMAVSSSNKPAGSRYARAFQRWANLNGFGDIDKSVRSDAMKASEHREEIERWRATLTDRERARLIHPLSNVQRWRASTTAPRAMSPTKKATQALRAFLRAIDDVKPSDLPIRDRRRALDWLSG